LYIANMKIRVKQFLKDTMFISAGVFSAGFGLKGFLLPNHFIDGGNTGISLLVNGLTGIPFPALLIIINFPFLILGYRIINREFAIKAILAILALAACTMIIPYPEITQDKLLVAVFGGFFLGAGIGLTMRGGAVIDGSEVLAIYLSKKIGATIGDIIMIFNILVFSVAAYFLSVETALYAMLTYLSASKTVDFVIEGIEEYTGVTIISDHADLIREMIINEMGRGVTIYKGEGGFGKTGAKESDIKIIYTVITRLEVSKLNDEIEKIDPQAFVVKHSIIDTHGGMIKKRPMKN
jgi:uncharacterized membrane-anchored protein YitT (DUF2179 family)